MISRLRDERGTGLIQLLVAMSLFAGILGATLTTFENFTRLNNRNVDRNVAQDAARTAVDRLSRDLRNLASPTYEQPQAVDRALPFDLVFQTVDSVGPNTGANSANVKRVRWCLDKSVATNEKLYVQEQTWTTQATPATPADTNCPGTGWQTTQVLAQNITNRTAESDRPLFTYNSATLTAINKIHVDLYSDLDPINSPAETHLTSGVFLRNQNAAPVAAFTATLSGSSSIVLNGSASYDPEGQSLHYVWWDNGTKYEGEITKTLPVTAGSTHVLKLQVFDPANLAGESAPKTITVPSS